MENENLDKNNLHECCMKKDHERNSSLHKYVLIIMVAALLLMSVVQSFQINSFKNMKPTQNQITANAVSLDMTGWTEDEKMMYEHHGTLPARLQGNQQPSSNMVGGC